MGRLQSCGRIFDTVSQPLPPQLKSRFLAFSRFDIGRCLRTAIWYGMQFIRAERRQQRNTEEGVFGMTVQNNLTEPPKYFHKG